MKQIILKSVGMIVLFLVAFTSCKKDESEVSNSINYTEKAVYEMQSDCALGKMGCFELIFPVTIQFADNSTLTVNSYDELKAGIKAWREANGKDAVRPQFVFPISVINEAGETIVVENQDQLKELRAACPDARRHGPKGHFERGLSCFDLVYPLTVVFPGGVEQIVNSKEELKDAIKTWRKDNPKTKEHPVIKFPFTVTLKADGTSVTINSKEDLIALKKSCRG